MTLLPLMSLMAGLKWARKIGRARMVETLRNQSFRFVSFISFCVLFCAVFAFILLSPRGNLTIVQNTLFISFDKAREINCATITFQGDEKKTTKKWQKFERKNFGQFASRHKLLEWEWMRWLQQFFWGSFFFVDHFENWNDKWTEKANTDDTRNE